MIELQWAFMENIKEILFLTGAVLGMMLGHAMGVAEGQRKNND